MKNDSSEKIIIKKRVVLLLAYFVGACFVSLIFAMRGEGTMDPIAIMGSWGIFISMLASRTLAGILIFCLLYFAALMLLNSVTSKFVRRKDPLVPAIIHGTGSLFALSKVGHGSFVSTISLILGYTFAIGLTLLFLALDWHFARESAHDTDDH